MITTNTMLSQNPYFQTGSNQGIGQYGYIEKDAQTFMSMSTNSFSNVSKLFARTFMNGQNMFTSDGAFIPSVACAGAGSYWNTSNFNFGVNAIPGYIAYTSIHADYCGGANSYGNNSYQKGFSERQHFFFDLSDRPSDMSSLVDQAFGKNTVVLSFKLDMGGVSGKYLNRFWIQNDGSMFENSEIANDGFKLFYEAATGSESFDGTESNAIIYGNYNGNSTSNNEYGCDALGIAIPAAGLRCYVVLNNFASCVAAGKTVKVSVMNDGISITPNMDTNFSLARIDKTPTSNTEIAVPSGYPSATGGSIASNQNVCENVLPADLTLSNYVGTIAKWQKASDMAFTTPIDISNTTAILSGATIGNLSNTTYFRTLLQNGRCADSYSSSTTISVPIAIWSGSWNVTPTASTSLRFNSDFSSSESISGCSCTVNSGTVIFNSNHSLSLTGVVSVNGGSLTFGDSSSLLQTNNFVNSGNITYKRNTSTITNNYDYVYWGSPVAGQTLSSMWMTGAGGTYYSFDANANNWSFENGNNTMTPGKGYISQSENGTGGWTTGTPWTSNFVGIPNNGNYTFPIIKSGSNIDNLIANPYPSALDLETFYDDNQTVISPNFYFWTHNTPISNGTTGTYTASDYATYNAILNAGVGTGTAASTGGSAPDRYVDAGQGFFCEGVNAGGTATFRNSQRVAGNNNAFYKTAPKNNETIAFESHKFWMNLYNNQGLFKQQLITYTQGATNDFDTKLDAVTFDSNEFLDFYSIIPENHLVIQSRNLPFQTQDVVALGFKTNVAGEYRIALDHFDGLFANQTIYLRDNLLNSTHNLTTEPYTFVTEAGVFNHRFEVVYENLVLQNPVFNFENELVVYKQNQVLNVVSSREKINSIQIYDLSGRKLYNATNLSSYRIAIKDFSDSNQVLLVTVTNEIGQKVIRKVVF